MNGLPSSERAPTLSTKHALGVGEFAAAMAVLAGLTVWGMTALDRADKEERLIARDVDKDGPNLGIF